MTTIEPRVGEQRPGGRAARVRASVLVATSQVLIESGYEKLNIEAVAKRAGVHKTTVYRRWPTKAQLVFDAVRAQAEANIPIPDTGTLLGDLEALALDVISNLETDGSRRQARTLVAAASTSEELAEGMNAFWARRFRESSVIVERAVERGELPSDADANLIVQSVVGPIWLRLLLTGEPIDDKLATRLATLVATGARGHA
ncbi:MAG: TetR/AcrR family transcriptional regulator [Acidimicrobiales bacterium]